MERRQFVKAMGFGIAGLCVNGPAAELSPAVEPPADGEMIQAEAPQQDDMTKVNNQIRREKFDTVLPEIMKKNDIDMWIYVMR
ncbi:MAG: hypothetical protein ACREBQ_13770, partial [Nitrososphaerales archaeon]